MIKTNLQLIKLPQVLGEKAGRLHVLKFLKLINLYNIYEMNVNIALQIDVHQMCIYI